MEHLLAIRDYVGRDSDMYADRLMDRLTRRSEQIRTFPRSGRQVPEYESPEVREVIEGSYRIIYRIGDEQIDVLAVIHSARPLPPALE
jgi:plasmid stabilization system protein ParE